MVTIDDNLSQRACLILRKSIHFYFFPSIENDRTKYVTKQVVIIVTFL